jgi:hypothetical protein
MAKAFALSFEYTPKWKKNRERAPEDRFTVRLRDFPESKRISITEEIRGGLDNLNFNEVNDTEKAKQVSSAITTIRKNNIEKSLKLVEENLLSINGLSVAVGDGETEITTASDLCHYCEELAMEIAARLVSGPDEDELKN